MMKIDKHISLLWVRGRKDYHTCLFMLQSEKNQTKFLSSEVLSVIKYKILQNWEAFFKTSFFDDIENFNKKKKGLKTTS